MNTIVAKSTAMNRDGMTRLQAEFKRLGIAYIPSVANFVSFRVARLETAKTKPVAGAVYDKLLRSGVIVRPLGGYEMPDHLRVTIGLPEENERFLAALVKALGLG